MKHLFTEGHIPWNKGKLNVYSDETLLSMSESHEGKKYKPMSVVGRRNISKAVTGKKHSKSTKQKMSEVRKGKPLTPEWRRSISIGHLKRNPIGRLNKKADILFRESFAYKSWRKSIFQRDDYTCVWCRERGGILHADHIKPFAKYPELRLEISNGRTLCKPCHMKTDTYGYGSARTRISINH